MKPGKHTGMTARLKEMKPGETITVKPSQSSNLFLFAKRLKIKIATRAEGKLVKVWRLQ